MDRRDFVAAGIGGALGAPAILAARPHPTVPVQDQVRGAFPRLTHETFVNAAGGTPLGRFAQTGLERYMEFQRLGPGEGREDYVGEMLSNIRAEFGRLIGARESEIALVHCTKAGEQTVIDGLEPKRHRRNIVTNDMHFSGSLHNLIGLKRAGTDVRIVRGRDWSVSIDSMEAAIDDQTALVAVTLVSNVTGRIEPIRELAAIAHAQGALVYADVIQATGIVPFNVRDLGIDFAASNGYKWLFGVHGAGFLYVRQELQGTALPDRLFPGHVDYNYRPWVDHPDPAHEDFVYDPRVDARRYQPGHVSYLGYCGVYEGMKFIQRIGVEAALAHSVHLNERLKEQLHPDRFTCISPHVDRSPIITFRTANTSSLEKQLRAANVVVTVGNDRVRVSPADRSAGGRIERRGVVPIPDRLARPTSTIDVRSREGNSTVAWESLTLPGHGSISRYVRRRPLGDACSQSSSCGREGPFSS